MKGCYLEKWLWAGSVLSALLSSSPTAAQIVPDATLPVNSTVTPQGNTNLIEGGTTAGTNLFHSFQEFSVPTSSTAFFNNAADIQNILTRVTGGSISNIDGTLRANGTANLFLLNPNGIIFGPNARLNIGGSFIGSTANGLNFTDGTFFSATPAPTTPLLTISVPIGLQYGSGAGSVQVRGSSLEVNPGKTLALAGGNVSMDGGQLVAPGGHVELVGVAAEGSVGLSANGDSLSLSFPQGVGRADVSLTNQAEVNVLAGGGGSIAVNARNLNLSEGSQLLAGISGVGLPDTQAGNIEINATGTVTITGDGSRIANEVGLGAVGNAGNINITAESLAVSKSAVLSTSTFGQGHAGNVTIAAGDSVSFDGGVDRGETVTSAVQSKGVGNAGDINITARSLSVINGTELVTSIRGQGDAGNIAITTGSLFVTGSSYLAASANGEGNAGNITINALDSVLFDGSGAYTDVAKNVAKSDPLDDSPIIGNGGNITITTESLSVRNSSYLFTSTKEQGDAGDLAITTGSLSVTDGSILAASANGQGNAGNITINARDTVSFNNLGQAYTDVTEEGKGGDINITARALSITNESQLVANTQNQGDAGNITITTGTLDVSNEAFITSNTNGQGNAGSITINAQGPVAFINRSSAFSNVTGTGKGGNITISAPSLNLINGSFLATGVGDNLPDRKAQGDAGNISILLSDALSLDRSYITTRVFANGIGNAGSIDIRAGSVSSSQSLISASTQGRGDAGRISVLATGPIALDDSDISTAVQEGAIGNGQGINITARSLSLTNGAQLNAVTSGEGNAGDILINTSNSVSVSGTNTTVAPINLFNYTPFRFTSPPEFVDGVSSGIFTSTNSSGVGGNIEVNTSAFSVWDGAVIDARTTANGRGGAIIVNTNTFDARSGGQLTAITSGSGTAGNISLKATDTVTITGSDPSYMARLAQFGSQVDIYGKPKVGSIGAASGLFANTEASSAGQGGNIQIATGLFTVQEGARLVTSTSGSGRAGDITVNAPEIQLAGVSSGLFAQTNTSADAGNLTIRPRGNGQNVTVRLQEGAQISASTAGSGQGGRLTITAPESITLTGNGSIISAETSGSGTGGNLTLQTGTLAVQDQAQVTVSSSGAGIAGSLFVDADAIRLDTEGRIRADTTGGGGDINLRSPLIVLRNGSSITTDARGSDIRGGDIRINTDNLVAVPSENSDISANSANFRGGNVTVTASGIFGIEFREQLTPLSDITATGVSSEFSGTVELITPGIDPARGLAQLPTEVVDASDEIAQGCRDVQGSSFVVTGRGGLPPTPQQALGDDPRWRDWRTQSEVSRQPNAPANGTLPPSANPPSTKSALVEATGWVFGADGQVILTASAPNVTSPNRWGQPINCDGS
jgi:filamentous hemagglutinin family protein